MNLEQLRDQIDELDAVLVKLFEQRMDFAAHVAEYKRANDLPILDRTREAAKLREIGESARPELQPALYTLYDTIFELSRSHQSGLLNSESALWTDIQNAIASTPQLFPQAATVACPGVEGAFTQKACDKLFKRPNIMHFTGFEGVFSAVESGLCEYGVVPIENSTAGSVTKIYNLLQRKDVRIVRSTRLKIDLNLAAPKNVKPGDVKVIYSHEQAINQCSEFLETLGKVEIVQCENTAIAAELVAKSGRTDVAAICSYDCLEVYGLNCLSADVQDKANNHTRFICISKNLEIYPGADRTSLLLTLPHTPGALHKALAKFYALGINLLKLESRPLPNRDFEFMFYFDLETSVYSEEFAKLLTHMDEICREFKYLGSYSEVV